MIEGTLPFRGGLNTRVAKYIAILDLSKAIGPISETVQDRRELSWYY